MQSLIYLFVAFINQIRAMVGLVLPMFAEAADFRTWPTWMRLFVTAIVFGVILFGLWWLNNLETVQNYLKTYAPTYIQKVYLPLLFILFCVLSWIGYFCWKLFNEEDAAEYPDIQAAWEEAIRKLGQEGIHIGDVPMYLIVGRPESGDDSLFLSSGQKIEIRVPSSTTAPIRLFATKEAIFVTCSGASTWGRFIDRLNNPDAVGGDSPTNTSAGQTMMPGQALAGIDEAIQEEFKELLRLREQRDGQLSPADQLRLQELGDIIQSTRTDLGRRVSMASDELTVCPRRLAYLCRLIAEDRRPWCPINGVLVLLPWSALETDDLSRTAIGVLSGDLAVIRSTFRLRYLQYVMVCDLEQAAGFDEFRRGFTRESLRSRIGQRIPVIPDRPADEMPEVLESVADWVRSNVMPSFVLNWLRLDWPPEARKTHQFVPSYNRKLFSFLHDLYRRGPRLGRVLANGLPVERTINQDDPASALPLVGGCYFAATGRDDRNQAFVTGVFQKLTESLDAVSWSQAAFADDRSYSRWAIVMYLLSLLLAAGTGFGVYVQFFR